MRGSGSKAAPPARPKSALAGPLRDVVYIFERENDRSGGHWRLVLECGHSVARKRYVPRKAFAGLVHLMFKPLSEKLAPKRVQCFYCESGAAPCDPWILIEAFGGPKRP